jgi:hypothetical protein
MSAKTSGNTAVKHDTNAPELKAKPLPEELKIHDKNDALSLVPELKVANDDLQNHLTTVSQILPKLEEILQAFKKIEQESAHGSGPIGTNIKITLPEHPNSAEVNCGALTLDPVVAVQYKPGTTFIPFFQNSSPTILSATLKSFDGKRDIKFADLVLSDDGVLDIDPKKNNDLVKQISSWIKAIHTVIDQDMQLKAQRNEYNGGNQHFESQLVDAVVQLLCLPSLELVYRETESDEKKEAEKRRAALIEGAHMITLASFEDARRTVNEVVDRIHSSDIEELRQGYLAKLKENFDAACEQVKPTALQESEKRLEKINAEIAQKEAQLNKLDTGPNSLQVTTDLYQFIDIKVRSHQKLSNEGIESSHKMKWAQQLSEAFKSAKKGLDLDMLKQILEGILNAAWMYKRDSSGYPYATNTDIDKAVGLTKKIVMAVGRAEAGSVVKVLADLKKSKSGVTLDAIEQTLTILCGIK